MMDDIGCGHPGEPQFPARVINEHSKLLVRRYERRPNLHSVPQQERHMFPGPAEIQPRDFQSKRWIVGIFVVQSEHLTAGDAIVIGQSIDMSEALCLMCKCVERRKEGRRHVWVRLLGRLRLLDEHELTSPEEFRNRMGCVSQ